ncbi:MAG: phosphatidylinositol-specific phospholipase C1-like protein [Candidatus Marinimicrobia bacterium]|nr:phosphatidylinositol-specific phospholipase C1-like protein [Candidatus Neomarinimicrobiota bacterium]
MIKYILSISLAVIFGQTPKPGLPVSINDIRINQLQVIGSHNSYRIKTPKSILNIIALFDSTNAAQMDYTHLSLPDQFDHYGIRQIEIDLYHDPNGGLYSSRFGNLFTSLPMASGIDALMNPGLKVLHFPDIDYETHYYTFTSALKAVKEWSDANPNHVPIFILVECKDEGIRDLFPFMFGVTKPLTFDYTALETVDAEIKRVFGTHLEKVITPDNVRGEAETLEEAILTNGWPSLGESRGKVYFGLDNGGSIRDLYIKNHPSLSGRILFTDSKPGTPEAAFIKQNRPTEEIAKWVQQGYIVRTRADADTEQARRGDTNQRDSALSSGAQFISTDYYVADARNDSSELWSDYSVQLPNGVAVRLNPINGPKAFNDMIIE